MEGYCWDSKFLDLLERSFDASPPVYSDIALLSFVVQIIDGKVDAALCVSHNLGWLMSDCSLSRSTS
jgi:hypothetical protein